MTIKGKAFQGTPQSAALMQPWIASPHLTRGGIPLGIDRRTGKIVMFDPWKMKLDGIIHSMIFLVLGLKDYGKSTFLKVLMIRLLMLQATIDQQTGEPNIMRGRLHGRKRENADDEMKPTNDFLRGRLLNLRDIGSINQFDPAMGVAEWDILETVVNDAEYARGSRLEHFQPLAFQIAVHKLLKQPKEKICLELIEQLTRTLDISDVNHYYEDVDAATDKMFKDKVFLERPDLIEQLQFTPTRPHAIDERELQHDASLGAADLNRIIAGRGDFGNTFGGTTSLREYLEDPMLTIDWNGINLRSRGLLESTLQKWQATAADRDDKAVIPHVNGADEAAEGMESLQWARFRLENIIKSRAMHTADIELAQNELQIRYAGEEGSELREKGRQISMGVGARFYACQNNDRAVLDHIAEISGMAEQDVADLAHQPKYCFVLSVPNRPPVPFQFFITPLEHELVETNSASKAMDERVPVTELASYQGRVDTMRRKGLTEDGNLLVLSGKQLRERAKTRGITDLTKELR